MVAALGAFGWLTYEISMNTQKAIIAAGFGALVFVGLGYALEWVRNKQFSVEKIAAPIANIDRTKNEGILLPGNSPDPDSVKCIKSLPADPFFVSYGSNIVAGSRPTGALTIIRMGGEPLLEVEPDNNTGNIIISILKIFNNKGEIIARVDKDGFWVRPDTRKKWPNDSTLVVFDHTDTQVLRLEYLNRRAISVEGIFRHPKSQTIEITNDSMIVGGGMRLSGNCGSLVRNIISIP